MRTIISTFCNKLIEGRLGPFFNQTATYIGASLLITFLELSPLNTTAEAATSGALIMRIPQIGVTSHCIEPDEKVWIGLGKLVTTLDSDWFSNDRAVGVIINTTINEKPYDEANFTSSNDSTSNKTSFFQMKEVEAPKDLGNGRTNVPIEMNVLDGFNLTIRS